MGGGDWNDGMNRVGIHGKGESVWLAWFLGHVLMRFAPVCESRGDADRASEFRAWAKRLAEAVEETSWDGAWYRRAYYDDGTPLGSRESEECRIDAIAQAWACISGLASPDRAEMALDSVDEKLIRREDGLVLLLDPPFDATTHDPGYIKGYIPGVRENGGQYTHAAAWVVLAYLLAGEGDEALGIFDLINPINHTSSAEGVERYVVEPYVVAGDVYATPWHMGRGGWTWYTGAAGWLYQVAVRWLLGLRFEFVDGVEQLIIDPCIPKDWPGYSMTIRRGGTTWNVRVENPRGVNRGVARVEVDGAAIDGYSIPLVLDDAQHEVVVRLLGG
jgi:cyclic beta-1,2-glucan synthetase